MIQSYSTPRFEYLNEQAGTKMFGLHPWTIWPILAARILAPSPPYYDTIRVILITRMGDHGGLRYNGPYSGQ